MAGAGAAEEVLRARPRRVLLETMPWGGPEAPAGGALEAPGMQVPGATEVLMAAGALDAAERRDPGAGALAALPGVASSSGLPAERLAAAAGLALGARLVALDRPKETTLRRLLHLPSTRDLDRAYGARVRQSYRELLAALGGGPAAPPPGTGAQAWPEGEGAFEGADGDPYAAILMKERDRVMAAVIRAEIEANAREGERARGDDSQEGVFVLVGEDHLPGLEHMLGPEGEPETLDAVAEFLHDPLPSPNGELAGEAFAVKRGVLEGLLYQTSQSMLGVAAWALEPVAPEFEDVRGLVALIYGHHRMALASCPSELLAEVSGERPGSSFWQSLEAFRQARPVNGGGGYSDAVVDQIVASAVEDLPAVLQQCQPHAGS